MSSFFCARGKSCSGRPGYVSSLLICGKEGVCFFPRDRKEDAFVLDHEIEKEKGKEERRFGPLN